MRNKEKELDDYSDEVYASREEFFKHHKILKGKEREDLKARIAEARGVRKNRVTIYFDADIVKTFKDIGEKEGVGYQTLMNEALRSFIEGRSNEAARGELKEEILRDKKFLKKLKSALAA